MVRMKNQILEEDRKIKYTCEVPTPYLNILQNKDFLELLHKEWDKHIVGEILPREIIFAIALGGSLCLNSQKTSNNLIVNSKSGTGKDYVTTKVLELIPGEETVWIKRTRISKTTFTYWHNSLKEPEWTWNQKIFYGEDMSYDVLNCEVFKVMSSGGTHSTIIKDQKAMNIKINGKPTIIITAANASLQDELIRRFGVIQLNETKEQDKEIIRHQTKLATTGVSLEYDETIKNSLSYLQPARVIIDFAEMFSKIFENMKANIIVRTNYNRFIDLIKYSAIIHQYQRRRTKDGSIYAEANDYDNAVDWFDYMFKNQYLLPLTHDQQRLLRIVKDLGPEATVKEIISEATFAGRTWTYTNLNLLSNKGFLEKERVTKEDTPNNKKMDVYTIVEAGKLSLPYYYDL